MTDDEVQRDLQGFIERADAAEPPCLLKLPYLMHRRGSGVFGGIKVPREAISKDRENAIINDQLTSFPPPRHRNLGLPAVKSQMIGKLRPQVSNDERRKKEPSSEKWANCKSRDE
jgi:hypothetical protein